MDGPDAVGAGVGVGDVEDVGGPGEGLCGYLPGRTDRGNVRKPCQGRRACRTPG